MSTVKLARRSGGRHAYLGRLNSRFKRKVSKLGPDVLTLQRLEALLGQRPAATAKVKTKATGKKRKARHA